MPNILVMSLNSLLEYFSVCFRKASLKPKNEVLEVSPNVVSNPENSEEKLSLKTWPVEKLKQNVENILSGNGIVMESDGFADLFSEILRELNEECPLQTLEQYDFCVICAFADQTDATELVKDIEERLKIRGFNVWEAVVLGKDTFEAYEEVVERSSKVIFYITENFTKDVFCCHLARNTFVAPTEKTICKVVPIINDASIELPDSLMLVDKLLQSNPYHMEIRLPFIFSDAVKLEKDLRTKRHKLDIDLRRVECLNRILVLHNVIK